MKPLVQIQNLSVRYPGSNEPAIHGIDLVLHQGEQVGVVGASGSGKSTLAASLIGLLPEDTEVSGSVVVADTEVFRASGEWVTREAGPSVLELRRSAVGFVFQNPVSTLDPVASIEKQFAEILATHPSARRSSQDTPAELLASVGLGDEVLTKYPHQLSGGMAQRVGIALALIGDPTLLIADEPTTSLDVQTQHEILTLLSRLAAERAFTLLFISHDLAIVSEVCTRVLCLSEGELVADSPTEHFLDSSAGGHVAVRGLVDAARVFYGSETGPGESAK